MQCRNYRGVPSTTKSPQLVMNWGSEIYRILKCKIESRQQTAKKNYKVNKIIECCDNQKAKKKTFCKKMLFCRTLN
jgi:hypothetical protein